MESKLQKWLLISSKKVVDSWSKALSKEKIQLTEKDFEKINNEQQIIGEKYVKEHLEWYKSRFMALYGTSKKPEILITDEIKGYNDILLDKELTNRGIWYNLGEMFTICGSKYSETSDKGYYNEIAYYHHHTWVRPIKDFWHNVSPSDHNRPYRYVSSLMAEVLARYVDWLKVLEKKENLSKDMMNSLPPPNNLDVFSSLPFDQETILEAVVTQIRDHYGTFDERGERTLENCMAASIVDLRKEAQVWVEKIGKYGIKPLIGQIEVNLEKWKEYLETLHYAKNWPRGNGARWNPRDWVIAKCGVAFNELLLLYAQGFKGKKIDYKVLQSQKSGSNKSTEKEPTTFEELLETEEKEKATINAMKKADIIDEAGIWKCGKFKSRIMAVVYALCDKSYINRQYYQLAGKLIAKKINTTISTRTTQESHRELLFKDKRAKYKEYYEAILTEL